MSVKRKVTVPEGALTRTAFLRESTGYSNNSQVSDLLDPTGATSAIAVSV